MRLRFAALACALACAIGTDALAQAISVNPGRSSNGVSLQATAPGTRQTGNLHVSGIAQATQFCLWGNVGNCSSYLIELLQLGNGGSGGIGFYTQGAGSGGASFPFMMNGTNASAPDAVTLASFGAGQVCTFANCAKLTIMGDGRLANRSSSPTSAHYLRGGLRLGGASSGTLYVGRNDSTSSALAQFVDGSASDSNTSDGQGWAIGIPSGGTAFKLTNVTNNVDAFSVTRTASPVFTVNALQVGASGTTISASFEGSQAWTPGALAAGSSTCVSVTVTGATAGATCAYGLPSTYASAAPYCQVSANSCTVCWQGTASGTPPSGTYRCRVFNP